MCDQDAAIVARHREDLQIYQACEASGCRRAEIDVRDRLTTADKMIWFRSASA